MEPDEAWCQNLAAVQTAVERRMVRSEITGTAEDEWAILQWRICNLYLLTILMDTTDIKSFELLYLAMNCMHIKTDL